MWFTDASDSTRADPKCSLTRGLVDTRSPIFSSHFDARCCLRHEISRCLVTNVTFLTTTILIATPPKIYCRPLQKKSGLRPGIINLSRIIHPYNHNRMIQLNLKSNPYPFRRPPRSAVRVGLGVDSTVAGPFCGFLANALRENAEKYRLLEHPAAWGRAYHCCIRSIFSCTGSEN